ncbi:MAG: two-component regulator propeller domain-containing protein [Thermoanaerobaculia bacterium]
MPDADNVRVIREQADGRLWVGTASGLYVFDSVRRIFRSFETETLPIFAQLGRIHVTALHEDGSGRHWVGTRNDGLFILDIKAGWMAHLTSRLDSPVRLPNDTIWSIVEDPSGLLWLGFGTAGGLGKLTERRFHNEAHNPLDMRSLSHDAVWSILEDRHGGLWVGATGGLNYRAPGAEGFERFQAEQPSRIPLPDSSVWALAESLSGEIWIGTHSSGIVRYDPATSTSKRVDTSLLGKEIRVLKTGHDGTIWIGTNGGGLSAFDPRSGTYRTYKTTDPDSGLSDDRIWSVLETRSGELWLGTDGSGIDVFSSDKKTFRHYTSEESNPQTIGSNHVWALYEDRLGRIWVGSKDGGLSLFQKNCGCFRRYTEATHDLPNDTIYGILEDRDGTLWLSTNHGLSNFDPGTEKFVNYDVHDGLPTNEFNFGAYHLNAKGRKLFGSIKGITTFYEIERRSNFQPPVVITEFTLASGLAWEELAPNQMLALGPGDDHFSFSFAALDFRSPNANRYEYILQGVDRAWRRADAHKRIASYSFLSPGTYIFKVRGTNRDGRWSEHFATAQVTVPAAFWQRGSFWGALAALALASVLVRLHRRRERYRRLQRRLFEGREAERTEMADLIHEGPIQSIITVRNQIGLPEVRNDLEGIVRVLRDICWETARPPKLAELGLATAMYDHISGLKRRRRHLPKVDVYVDEDVDEFLRPSDLVIAYRLFQKGLNNAIQHANATRVLVRVRRVGNSSFLEIEDDGVGFEVPARWSELAPEHYGLLSSFDAVKSIGGKFDVKSKPQAGTVFQAWLPVRRSHRRFGLYALRSLWATIRIYFNRRGRI